MPAIGDRDIEGSCRRRSFGVQIVHDVAWRAAIKNGHGRQRRNKSIGTRAPRGNRFGGWIPRLTGLGRNAFGAILFLKSQPNDLLDGKALCEGEPLRKGFSFFGQIDHVLYLLPYKYYSAGG
jgi:hypothetical protein